ncbi:hypothetical protein GW7_15658 [Heterocephalus glaber]|uniref:Uncharacterized protein n=1 Tax=Heterocephalus glaber TaxID=10181 RepID=G5B2C6_HETGA|nr:hypothetical protein GW7_15658 [Heterocephalus glaber]
MQILQLLIFWIKKTRRAWIRILVPTMDSLWSTLLLMTVPTWVLSQVTLKESGPGPVISKDNSNTQVFLTMTSMDPADTARAAQRLSLRFLLYKMPG